MSREWFFMRKMADRLQNTVKLSERGFWLLFLIILIVAWLLRFYDLSNLPCGLAPDEADVARVASEGKFQAVYDNPYNEAEGFFVSWLIVVFSAFGQGVKQVFAASAFLGWLTVLFTGLAVRKHFSKVAALLTIAFLTTSTWHIATSQSGTRNVVTPLSLSLLFFIYPKLSVQRKGRIISDSLFGVALSLGFYGYPNYRVIILVIIFGLILHIHHHSGGLMHTIKAGINRLLPISAGFLLSIFPLIHGYIQFPSVILARTQQTSIFSSGIINAIRQLLINGVLIVQGFFFGGAKDWHKNLDQLPLVAWYLSPFFFLGLAWSIRQTIKGFRNSNSHSLYPLVFPSFLAFLLPDLLTDATPHGSRLNGELPLIYILIAIGFLLFIRLSRKMGRKSVLSIILIASLLAISLSSTFRALKARRFSQTYAKDYFCEMRDVGEYLIAQRKVYKASGAFGDTIWIVGSWYDISPLNFYLKDDPGLSVSSDVRSVDYEEVSSGLRFGKGDTIIVPAYITHSYNRIHTWLANNSAAQQTGSLIDVMKLHNPQLKEIHSQYHPNRYWFPGNISFRVLQSR